MEHITLIPPNSLHRFVVPAEDINQRLDVYLKKQFPSYSRNFLQALIEREMVLINDKIAKSHTFIKLNDTITVTFPPVPVASQPREIPSDLNVEIVHMDQHFMVVNKPANLSVHPPKLERTEVTLVDWLINTFQDIKEVGYTDRPGIVHRLDKDTSGIMIIARNNCAHAILSDMFKNRTVEKTYLAVVAGHPDKEGTIDFAIMRHPTKRNTMTHVTSSYRSGSNVRDAKTNYRVLEYFKECSLVEVKPLTGRTHQIRIHFTAIGHPLIGDYVYGKKSKEIARQALHAHRLAFEFNGKLYDIAQNPPADFQNLLEILRNNETKNST